MEELIQWLDANKIQSRKIDDEVIEIEGMGKLFYQDTEKVNSIFKTDPDGELVFNYLEEPSVLMKEGINYVTFKFGDNWYYSDVRKDFALNILKYVGVRKTCKRAQDFVNLGVHTPYELLNGSFLTKEWVRKAQYLGHKAIGVCDNNTMAALFSLQKDCESAGMTPVFGYSMTVDCDDSTFGCKVYVQSQTGLRNMLRIQKAIMVDSSDATIHIDELITRADGNVLVFDKYCGEWLHENKAKWLDKLSEAFDSVFFQVDFTEYKAERIDIEVLKSAKRYFDDLYDAVAPVLISDCYYLDKDDAKNKIILNKVACGAAHEQSDEQYYKDIDEHYETFVQILDEKRDIDAIFNECCQNTLVIANGAKAKFDTSRNYMPQYDMTEDELEKYGTPHQMFTQLLNEGLERLVPECDRERYRKQMEYEKYIIESTNNVDYLLVQYDTVNWCRRNNILVGCGRGSAAGSLLLYLLRVTLVDPMKYGLIFERFLLPERAGLYPAQTTIIGEDVESTEFVEVELANGKTIRIDKDAQLIVSREGVEEPLTIYADELKENDIILFDNKDEIFTINEL